MPKNNVFQNGRHFTGQLFYYSNNSKSSWRIFTKFDKVIGSGLRTYRSNFEKNPRIRTGVRACARAWERNTISKLRSSKSALWNFLKFSMTIVWNRNNNCACFLGDRHMHARARSKSVPQHVNIWCVFHRVPIQSNYSGMYKGLTCTPPQDSLKPIFLGCLYSKPSYSACSS